MSTVFQNKDQEKIGELLDDAQAVEFFEKQVRAYLNISSKEFLEKLENGEYKDSCDNPSVMKLRMMIPQSLRSCDK